MMDLNRALGIRDGDQPQTIGGKERQRQRDGGKESGKAPLAQTDDKTGCPAGFTCIVCMAEIGGLASKRLFKPVNRHTPQRKSSNPHPHG